MSMQRDFWVKNGVLGENGHAKGLLDCLGGKLVCKGTFGLKMGFWGKMGM